MKLSFRLKKSPEFVFDHLTDMQKFVSVHPVIARIDSKGNGQYLVYETLLFLGIPVSFRYTVILEINTLERFVTMHASVMQLVKIEIKYVLKADMGFTLVEEKINFRSILPVKFILQAIFKKQHEKLFINIEKKLTPTVNC